MQKPQRVAIEQSWWLPNYIYEGLRQDDIQHAVMKSESSLASSQAKSNLSWSITTRMRTILHHNALHLLFGIGQLDKQRADVMIIILLVLMKITCAGRAFARIIRYST